MRIGAIHGSTSIGHVFLLVLTDLSPRRFVQGLARVQQISR